MALKTQGTNLYVIDPDDDSVITVGCVTAINGISTEREQIDVTCLEDDARSFLAGLNSPAVANFSINFDFSDASHMRLHALHRAGTTLNWAVGASDGTEAPTVDTGGTWDLGTGRSWARFQGYIASFPFDVSGNAVWQSNVGIQVSGQPLLYAKA